MDYDSRKRPFCTRVSHLKGKKKFTSAKQHVASVHSESKLVVAYVAGTRCISRWRKTERERGERKFIEQLEIRLIVDPPFPSCSSRYAPSMFSFIYQRFLYAASRALASREKPPSLFLRPRGKRDKKENRVDCAKRGVVSFFFFFLNVENVGLKNILFFSLANNSGWLTFLSYIEEKGKFLGKIIFFFLTFLCYNKTKLYVIVKFNSLESSFLKIVSISQYLSRFDDLLGFNFTLHINVTMKQTCWKDVSLEKQERCDPKLFGTSNSCASWGFDSDLKK